MCEEIEALKNLKHIIKYWKPNDKNDELANIEYNSIKIAVSLIDKLQKENEELKEEIVIYKETQNDLEHEILRYEEDEKHIRENFVSKDEFRKIIKKYIFTESNGMILIPIRALEKLLSQGDN